MTGAANISAWLLRIGAPLFIAAVALAACNNSPTGQRGISAVLEPTPADVAAAIGEDELVDENLTQQNVFQMEAKVAADGGANSGSVPAAGGVAVNGTRVVTTSEAGTTGATNRTPVPSASLEASGTVTALAPQATRSRSGNFFSSLFGRKRSSASVNSTKNAGSAGFGFNANPRPPGAVASGGATGLPGVDLDRVYAMDGIEDETGRTRQRIRIGGEEPVRVASVTNLARRAANGVLVQRPDVEVHCFPPRLLSLLKKVERRFGRSPVVTSGYRSTRYNRKVRGARNSQHTFCRAADIQVKGVSKWTLARYLRTLPGRGGVGTYCHTKSVHIDVGSKRDWNRKCRRKPGKA